MTHDDEDVEIAVTRKDLSCALAGCGFLALIGAVVLALLVWTAS